MFFCFNETVRGRRPRKQNPSAQEALKSGREGTLTLKARVVGVTTSVFARTRSP